MKLLLEPRLLVHGSSYRLLLIYLYRGNGCARPLDLPLRGSELLSQRHVRRRQPLVLRQQLLYLPLLLA